MQCMRCGKDTSANQVFCDECLQDMEKYPVKPGTPIHLPSRPNSPVVHKYRPHRIRKPEEQITSLKNLVTWLCVLCCLLLVTAVLSILLNLQLLGNKDINILPGQDYNINEAFGALTGNDSP